MSDAHSDPSRPGSERVAGFAWLGRGFCVPGPRIFHAVGLEFCVVIQG